MCTQGNYLLLYQPTVSCGIHMVAMILLWMPGLTQWAKQFETPHCVMYQGYPQNGQVTINLAHSKAHLIWDKYIGHSGEFL
jgi:hypothetical protein